MQEALVGAVRVVHIASAIALAGGGFLWVLVVAPTISRHIPGLHARDFMLALGPKLGRYFSILAYIVFLSGATLLSSIFGWRRVFDVLLSGGLYGSILLTGILAFVVGLFIAETVIMPVGRRLSALPADTPPAVVGRLQRRQAIAFVVVSALDFVALAMMALAVNVRA